MKSKFTRHFWDQAALAALSIAGTVLAVIPAFSFSDFSDESRLLVIAMIFAAAGVSALTLIARPIIAAMICTALTGVSAHTAFVMGSPMGAALGCFAIAYGGAILFYIRQHQSLLDNAEPAETSSRPVDAPSGLSAANHAQFLGKVVQELRPALSNITGFAEILLSPAADNMTETEIRIHHQTLLDSSRGISAFVSDVHDMVRIDQNRLQLQEQEVDAAELAEIAIKMCRDEAERADVVIVLSVFDGVELRCDAVRIKQMLVCLVTRAIRASTSGGIVRVSFDQTAENGLAIAVANKGIVLEQPEIALIFEPALHDHGLNGLALPIAQRIAMLHGGNVTIESIPGAGTTARLILPACRISWASGKEIETTRVA